MQNSISFLHGDNKLGDKQKIEIQHALKDLLNDCIKRRNNQIKHLSIQGQVTIDSTSKESEAKIDQSSVVQLTTKIATLEEDESWQKVIKSSIDAQDLREQVTFLTKKVKILNERKSAINDNYVDNYLHQKTQEANDQISQDLSSTSKKTKAIVAGGIAVAAIIGSAWYLGCNHSWFNDKFNESKNYITNMYQDYFGESSLDKTVSEKAAQLLADDQFHEIQAERLIEKAKLGRLSRATLGKTLRKITQEENSDIDNIAEEIADTSLFKEIDADNKTTEPDIKMNLKNKIKKAIDELKINHNARNSFIKVKEINNESLNNLQNIYENPEKISNATALSITKEKNEELTKKLNELGVDDSKKDKLLMQYKAATEEQLLELIESPNEAETSVANRTLNHLEDLADNKTLSNQARQAINNEIKKAISSDESNNILTAQKQQIEELGLQDKLTLILQRKFQGTRSDFEEVQKFAKILTTDEINNLKSIQKSGDAFIFTLTQQEIIFESASNNVLKTLNDKIEKVNLPKEVITNYINLLSEDERNNILNIKKQGNNLIFELKENNAIMFTLYRPSKEVALETFLESKLQDFSPEKLKTVVEQTKNLNNQEINKIKGIMESQGRVTFELADDTISIVGDSEKFNQENELRELLLKKTGVNEANIDKVIKQAKKLTRDDVNNITEVSTINENILIEIKNNEKNRLFMHRDTDNEDKIKDLLKSKFNIEMNNKNEKVVQYAKQFSDQDLTNIDTINAEDNKIKFVLKKGKEMTFTKKIAKIAEEAKDSFDASKITNIPINFFGALFTDGPAKLLKKITMSFDTASELMPIAENPEK